MKTVFDPMNLWLGASPLVLSSGNKLPVALEDALTVLRDAGPVTVDALANDFDPEGSALTLISATASLGTAQAETDNTITYTPPPGITGFDTVVYEIADDLDQRQTGQINVVITEPDLSVAQQPDNTLVVNAQTGVIDITITEPAEFAGTYQADTADILTGPLPLRPPTIAGTPAEGEVLSANPGLWIFEAGEGQPTRSWLWRRGGTDISGATSDTYTVASGDLDAGLTVLEVQADGYGQRLAESSTVGSGFVPSVDPQLLGWWDAADTGTITHSGGAVSAWADKAGGPALVQNGASQPVTGSRVLNGQNVIDFDGTQLLEATRSLPASGDVAFHVVLQIDTTDNVFDSLLSVDGTNDFQIDARDGTQFSGRLNVSGIGSSVDLTGGPFSGALILSLVFDRTGAGLASVYIANLLRGSTAYTAALDSSVLLRLMGNRAGNYLCDGGIAEVIVTGDISASRRADHHAYLASKWGLA